MSHDNQQPNQERDDIAVLMRVAGRRRAVPAERMQRAREAARAEWQQAVTRGRSSRRRRIGIAASVTAAAVLALGIAIRVLPTRSHGPTHLDPAVLAQAIETLDSDEPYNYCTNPTCG